MWQDTVRKKCNAPCEVLPRPVHHEAQSQSRGTSPDGLRRPEFASRRFEAHRYGCNPREKLSWTCCRSRIPVLRAIEPVTLRRHPLPSKICRTHMRVLQRQYGGDSSRQCDMKRGNSGPDAPHSGLELRGTGTKDCEATTSSDLRLHP